MNTTTATESYTYLLRGSLEEKILLFFWPHKWGVDVSENDYKCICASLKAFVITITYQIATRFYFIWLGVVESDFISKSFIFIIVQFWLY